jgi:ATP-dependent RNA helicase MSS116
VTELSLDVHRLGRTARAGNKGHGVLVLADFETMFLNDKTMRTFPLQTYPTIAPDAVSRSRALVDQALGAVPNEAKAQAYQAWLGYYNSNLRALKWSQADLVRNANDYARDSLRYRSGETWQAPGLLAKTVGKMGLKGVPGLHIVKDVQGGGQRAPRGAQGAPPQPKAVEGGMGGHQANSARGGSGGQRGGRSRGGFRGAPRGRGGSRTN